MKSYINPSVKLINSTGAPFLNYFVWLKSRQWVVTDRDGNKFMTDLYPLPNWLDSIPSQFYVGDELVDKYQYMDRIQDMNLQYNNFDQYIFEIEGSCLFRDFLFNINKISQWAQSNRFLFSILDEEARFDEQHYHISAEYKDISEWEEQFDRYMQAIKDDPIVDHNRLEMPYSISSTFWISVNRKTLLDLLGFMKREIPFFFEVYGLKFMAEAVIADMMIPSTTSAAITQYVLKHTDTWKEGVTKVDDTYIVNSQMGLILYSQFIRQADTRISGYFNQIMHSNSEEFVHKVFKGSTTFPIHYVADEDKVMSTVKTRLCAFAMSSGNDPCSWSYFLNNFIPNDIRPSEFISLLPCSFHKGRLMNCKFHDDIKFRNEGKEISNCPCPLVTLSIKDAEVKLERDQNRVGKAYYDLTDYIINDGLKFELKELHWTSQLTIRSNNPITNAVKLDIIEILNSLENCYSKFIKPKDRKSDIDNTLPDKYKKYGLGEDYTCMMKGRAIDLIAASMRKYCSDKFIISFGNDLFVSNCRVKVHAGDSKFIFNLDGTYSIFTSGNNDIRGNHILTGSPDAFSTVVVKWDDVEMIDNTWVDIIATKNFAGDNKAVLEVEHELQTPVFFFDFDEDRKLINYTYCASPFFNESQVEIRDRMVENFCHTFRPDLTDSEKDSKSDHDNDSVEKVVEDNIRGISQTECLVFPSRTTDLGTLFEVGVALAQIHPIIRFDEKKEIYLVSFNDFEGDLNWSDQYLFDCSKKSNVIAMGYASMFLKNDQIKYQLKGCPDNIMLSVKYTHVEKNGNEFVIIKRDPNERDK